jgi:hypothetical protein
MKKASGIAQPGKTLSGDARPRHPAGPFQEKPDSSSFIHENNGLTSDSRLIEL